MNKDQVEGKIKDAKGRVERQVGEWTDSENAQAKGLKDQAEGKIQKGVGDLKEGAKKAMDDVRRKDADRDVEKEEIRRKDRNVA